jgi:hypothetical protein
MSGFQFQRTSKIYSIFMSIERIPRILDAFNDNKNNIDIDNNNNDNDDQTIDGRNTANTTNRNWQYHAIARTLLSLFQLYRV